MKLEVRFEVGGPMAKRFTHRDSRGPFVSLPTSVAMDRLAPIAFHEAGHVRNLDTHQVWRTRPDQWKADFEADWFAGYALARTHRPLRPLEDALRAEPVDAVHGGLAQRLTAARNGHREGWLELREQQLGALLSRPRRNDRRALERALESVRAERQALIAERKATLSAPPK